MLAGPALPRRFDIEFDGGGLTEMNYSNYRGRAMGNIKLEVVTKPMSPRDVRRRKRLY